MTAMYFDARIDGTQLQRDVANINKQISLISTHMKKEGTEIDAISSRIGTGLAGAFSIFAAGNFVKDIARVRGEFQQLQVAFETMLGSKAKADILFAQVVDFAFRTPFELTEVASGTKQLLAYGVAAEDIIPTLKSLGDVSAGLSVPIERIILNYGQVRTQLKLTGRELRDFNLAGVPLISELAKQLGVAESKIADMVERGQIGFPEVEKAFRSMTEEGGRFNNLMDKQAKTITGLASNFADAWDKMLNSMGQQNEGVIAGSIRGAITLTENYEEVLKILKILIATYGTYKAAVIATGVATRVSAQYGVYDIATKKLQTAATLKAAAAQTALNVAQKANPYALILSAVASLVTILTVYNRKAEDSSKISAEFTKNLADETTAVKKAFDAVKNAKDGTNERAKAIQEVNDKYRDYLPNLLTEASNLYEVEKAQNAVTSAVAKTLAFKAQEDSLKDLGGNVEKQLVNFYKQINDAAKKLDDAQKGQFTALIEGYKESLKKQFEKRGYFDEFSVNRINDIFKQISGENLGGWALGDLDLALKSLIIRETELQDKTEGLKTTYEEYLKALGIGEAPPEPVLLTTVNARIEETKRLIDEAKQKLNELRASDSTASVEDIDTQENRLKELEKTLTTLTGISKKAQDEFEKSAKERLKALMDFAEQEIQLERNLQASRIAIMQQGNQRQKAEAEYSYQQELDRIKQQQQAFLEAWNAKQGFEPGDKGFISELPAEELAKFDELRVSAEQSKNKRIEEINRETANEIKAIWQEVNDVFLSESERDIQSINNRYDELINRAKTAGESDFSAINNARAKAIEEATINSGLKILDFEEEIALRKTEIDRKYLSNNLETEKKRIAIYQQYAKLRISLLQKSNQDSARAEIESLKIYIEELNAGLDEIASKEAENVLTAFNEISNAVSQIDGELGNVVSTLATVAENAFRAFGSFSGGNILGGVTSSLTALFGLISLFKKEDKTDKYVQSLERINHSLEIQAKILATLSGEDYYLLATKQVDKFNESISTNVSKLREARIFTKEEWQSYQETFKQLQADFPNFYGKMTFTDYVGAKPSETDLYTLDEFYKAWLTGAVTLNKEQEEWLANAIEQQKQIADLNEEIWNKATGTTRNSIADSIIEGFKSGYNSAADFAENFEGLMKTAILNAFKMQLIEGDLTAWYKGFALAAEDGLTKDEIDFWEGEWDKMIEGQNAKWNQIQQVTGINPNDITDNSQQGIVGSFKSLTEETGGLIAGQFYAFRELQQRTLLTAQEQLDSINQSVTHLARIEENTRYNKHLEEIRDDIKQMNTYLKQVV